MFVLDPQKPRLRKRKGSTQTCPSELLQPPLRDAQPVLPAKYRLVLWAELNLYPATFSKQYQGFIRRAFQQNPLLIQHWLRAIERDRERELWWCSLTVNSQLWARDLLQHVHEENSLSFFFSSFTRVAGEFAWDYARDRLDHVLACWKTTNIYIIGSNGIWMSTSNPHRGQNRACLQIWHILILYKERWTWYSESFLLFFLPVVIYPKMSNLTRLDRF